MFRALLLDEIEKAGILEVVTDVYKKSTNFQVCFDMQAILVEQSVKILHAVKEKPNLELQTSVLEFYRVIIKTPEKVTKESLYEELGIVVEQE
jgi:hypothetical protein